VNQGDSLLLNLGEDPTLPDLRSGSCADLSSAATFRWCVKRPYLRRQTLTRWVERTEGKHRVHRSRKVKDKDAALEQ
jgi:hypothetical protein